MIRIEDLTCYEPDVKKQKLEKRFQDFLLHIFWEEEEF